MYIRFVMLAKDMDSRHPEGLIIGASRLIEEDVFDREEQEAVEQILRWFNQNLKIPPLLKQPGRNRCLSWFKPEAKEALRMMWELFNLLKKKGVAVDFIKKEDVGNVFYEDECQIVAQPYRHNRKRHY